MPNSSVCGKLGEDIDLDLRKLGKALTSHFILVFLGGYKDTCELCGQIHR